VRVVTLMGQQGGAPCPTKSEERKPALRFCLSPRCEYYATSPAPQAPAVASQSMLVVTRLLPQDAVVGPQCGGPRGAANVRRTWNARWRGWVD
jgi:hypothetical protein